jgi:hypothetical protein
VNVSYNVRDNITVYFNGSNVTGEIENYYVKFADGKTQYFQPERVRAALHPRHPRQVVIYPSHLPCGPP